MAKTTSTLDGPHFEGLLDLTAPTPMGVSGEIVQVTQREFDTMDKEYEAFMQLPMVIRIHESADVRSAPAVAVGCNGERKWLPRGRAIKIQRKFVENLARSKEMHVRTEANGDRSSDEGTLTRRHATSPYGFEILHDSHPKGRAWIERVLHEAAA
jgi:hypothetical protein